MDYVSMCSADVSDFTGRQVVALLLGAVRAGSGVFFYVSINLHIKKAMLKYNYKKMGVSIEVKSCH